MATADPIPELGSTVTQATTDLLVLVAAMLPENFESLLVQLTSVFPAAGLIIASENPAPAGQDPSLRMIGIGTPPGALRWSLSPANVVHAWKLAEEHNARGVIILGTGSDSLGAPALHMLGNTVLAGSADLVVPRYLLPPRTGLISSSIIYPLTRALFATRIRFPLAVDLGLSPRMAQRMALAAERITKSEPSEALLWPVNEAAVAGFAMEDFDVGVRTLPQPAEGEINTILARVTGSLFSDIEAKAAFWQRARRVPPPRPIPPQQPFTDGATEMPRMVESFRYAYNNLLEIWSLVLPPQSLLALKRLSLMAPAQFLMPDSLWARIVYDFLIAYRLRTMNRSHLLGAFIPLYRGWVASHINLTAAGTDSEAHIEAVAAAFEADKPYVVSRWRWPDRFNA
jgi:glucosylglycerate synthase